MRKVVGALFVTAVLACGTRAQADPMSTGQFSGLELRQYSAALHDAWTAEDTATAWSRFTSEVRERMGDDDADVSAYMSFVRTRWSAAAANFDADDRQDMKWFTHGLTMFAKLKPAQGEKFWARMHAARRTGCLPRESQGPPHSAVNPEPASMLLMGTGLVGLVGIRRVRGKKD